MNAEPELRILIAQSEIAVATRRLAAGIRVEYGDKYPLILGVLKGAFIFLADLVRNLDFPLQLDFIQLASYGNGTCSSGKIALINDLTVPVLNRHVLVVEDVVDTGQTTSFLIEYLKQKSPISIKLCTLIDKPSRRLTPIKIDYCGFSIPDKFIAGYGMDYNEKYRNLPDIYSLANS
jgi:hypoxanthine phosphoribosyltransferase